MASRGPDDKGLWTDSEQQVGLAHRRLSILDLSDRGAQPMTREEGRLAVSYNGEIYNYPALRDRLEKQGYHFRSDTDTEVLLHLYAEHGSDMVDHLRGMYAFALWDGARNGLFLARDPYGIKPLYVADDGETLHVTSQVRALRGQPGVDTARRAAGHVGFFLWGHVPDPHTLYRGIRALPAGHTQWVDASGPQSPARFADVAGAFQNGATEEYPPPLNGTPEETQGQARTQFENALRESVKQHLLADVDVGFFLSAGLDSASLLALAAEHTDRVQTVTLGFEEYRGTAEDEVPGAERLARRYGTDHDTVWVTHSDFAAAHDDLFAAMDQPTVDGVNTYFVSRAAAQTGLKVALSGLGGDELLGGYPSFHQIPRLVSIAGRVPAGRMMGRGLRAMAAPVVRQFTSPKYAGLLEYGGTYGGAYLLRRGLYMPWELPDVLDTDLVRKGWKQLQPLVRLNETVDAAVKGRAAVSALESCWYMRNQLLRDTDWASMAHSLEVRTPLVDWSLLQSVGSTIARSGFTKHDMARVPERPLPESVLSRPKTGFSVPLREWLLEGRPEFEQARGLRGWAQYVYRQKWGET
jgi:asparagine synthase (glutamine-hydrolysing)